MNQINILIDSVKRTFCEENCPSCLLYATRNFSRRLSNNSLGGFVPKQNRQSFIILIFVVLNSFVNKRLKLKFSDFMSDLDKCIDSKPNNYTGICF